MHRHPYRSTPIGAAAVTACLSLLVVFVLPGGAAAQEEPPEAERADTVTAELERLRVRLDSLEAVLRELGADRAETGAVEDDLAALRDAARAAAGGERTDTARAGRDAPASANRQRSLQALNPEISVNADIFGHVNVDDPDRENFVPREFEISLQSALDPYSRAKVFLSYHAEGPELVPFGEGHGHGHGEEGEEDAHGTGLGVEEGYVEWLGLPGGVSLRAGRFFQRFGALNRWHAHALPFQSRSLPHLAFIGEEALAQDGVSASVLLPVGGSGSAYEAALELTRSTNQPLFGESTGLSVLASVNGFWQLGRSADLDLGLSWIHGSYEDEEHALDRNLYGVETAFTWRPPGRALYRGVVVRAGAMLLDGLVVEEEHEEEGEHEEEEEEHGAEADHALGLWSMAEVRLSERLLAGARVDWAENPRDPHETAWLVSPTLTWWQSEWVRLRLEYDLLGRSALEDEGRLWLQVTFAMGPHKHETY